MNIVLIEKLVPKVKSSSQLTVCDQVKKIQANYLGNYSSEYVPRAGELVWYTNDNYYYVLNVIHIVKKSISPIFSNVAPSEIEVILEVCPYSDYQFYINLISLLGSDLPLVTEIDNYT